MDKIDKKEITSVSDAIDIINDLRYAYEDRRGHHIGFPFWFRGQNIAENKLIPTIFRNNDEIDSNFVYREDEILRESELLLAKYKNEYKTTFDWLCLLQHYRLPTRLLDWTESILVALFFAVEDTPNSKNKSGKLFLLSPTELNIKYSNNYGLFTPNSFETIIRAEMTKFYFIERLMEYLINLTIPKSDEKLTRFDINLVKNKKETIKSMSFPIAVLPNRLNDRIIFQSGVFTLHGGKAFEIPERDKWTPLPKPALLEEINDNFLQSFKIPKEYKKNIRNELMMLGIHRGSLFPELEYQTSIIKNKWKRFSEKEIIS